MEARVLIHRRSETRRYTVKGFLPGKLLDATEQQQINARPLDVSRRGLAVLITGKMPNCTHMWFHLDDSRRIKLEIAYCQSHLGIENVFKCGFYTKDPDFSLEDFFLAKGLIDPNDYVADGSGI